ncbi:DEAD/DEAH box helicase domain-containing protein [Cardiosporidium cionae]|uniref:RNA helicase n=1 Tax=Cardiosporidium cionae TaxID=476202 RepID=A0ABQ7JFY6_9APIC|nr:DEAD/DEAH box helicase domain-containing protein [Cardiosporidium cionae]|eukprot:KAF8822938.1 DEAD/DEAH box helicase domain-containing protein [Cardiosporidium cionae]
MDRTAGIPNGEVSGDICPPQKLRQTFVNFGNLHFDRRITKAIASHFKFTHPTTIQSKMIPMALEGKDMLVRARTGSGKTIGYAIPVIHKLLSSSEIDGRLGSLRAVILVPTKELCEQVYEVFHHLLRFCNDSLSVGRTSELKKTLSTHNLPTIIVCTPTTLLSLLEDVNKHSSKRLDLRAACEVVVVDEADLIFSYGFQRDMQKVCHFLPTSSSQNYQAILCSATLSPDVEQLKSILLHKPGILSLEEEEEETGGILKEFYFQCPEEDKWLFVYASIKLEILPMKCLIFTSTIDRAHSLSIFLGRFSIPSTVLCPTLPFISRQTILQSFNQSVFEILIVTEETTEWDEQTTSLVCGKESTLSDAKRQSASHGQKKPLFDAEKEYVAAHRGLDLQGVGCVLNFDIPLTKKSYIHRIGRTARGGASGTALSLISMNSEREKIVLSALLAEKTARISSEPRCITPFEFDLNGVEKFRYRVMDVLQGITKKRIASSRLQLLQKEILHSKQLKLHFKENPSDAFALKKAMRNQRFKQSIQDQLCVLPSYLETSTVAVKTMNASIVMPLALLLQYSFFVLCCFKGFSFLLFWFSFACGLDAHFWIYTLVIVSMKMAALYGAFFAKTAVQLAVLQEADDAATEKGVTLHAQPYCTLSSKRRMASSNPLQTFEATSQKKQAVQFSCYNQLKKEPLSYSLTAPDELPVLAGRKLWKLRHKKKLKKPGLPGNFLKKKSNSFARK